VIDPGADYVPGDDELPDGDTIVVSSRPSLIETLERHRNLQISDPATRRRTRLRGLFAMLSQATPEPYEPKTYREATNDTNWPLWEKSMKDENDSLVANNTWTLVDSPPNRRVLPGKWVYKLKRGPQGEILRFKSRWVVRASCSWKALIIMRLSLPWLSR
jgi:hypothetical protein